MQSPAPSSSRRAQPSREDSAPSGMKIARLQILDWNEGDSPDVPAEPAEDPAAEALGETSLEFTLPPGELDRIFVETKRGVLPRMPRVPPVESDEPEEIEVFNAADPIVDISAPAAAKPKTPAATAAAAAASAPAPSGFEVSEDVRREMLRGLELTAHPESLALERADRSLEDSAAPFDLGRQKSDRGFTPWLAAAITAGALLLVQVVHQNREWLATHAPLGGSIRALYSTIGAPVAPPANLSAYQLRQWGVAGDPPGAGTLRVPANSLNTAAQLQPYPLLPVTPPNRSPPRFRTRHSHP